MPPSLFSLALDRDLDPSWLLAHWRVAERDRYPPTSACRRDRRSPSRENMRAWTRAQQIRSPSSEPANSALPLRYGRAPEGNFEREDCLSDERRRRPLAQFPAHARVRAVLWAGEAAPARLRPNIRRWRAIGLSRHRHPRT